MPFDPSGGFDIDSPDFKAYVRSSSGGGRGPTGGSGGPGGFPSSSASSLSATFNSSTPSLLAGGLRRRLPGGLTSSLLPAGGASLPMRDPTALSTTPSMSAYGTAAGGRQPNTPLPPVPVGGAQPPSRAPRPPGTADYGRKPRFGGGGGPAPVDPNDPYAGATGNLNGLIDWLIHQAGAGGVFDVNGNPMLATMARENVMGDAGARESAARTSAMLHSGGDPSMAGFASLMSGLNTAGQASGAANDAALKSATTNQQMLREILMSQLAPRAQQQQQPDEFLTLLGQLGGGLLGGLL